MGKTWLLRQFRRIAEAQGAITAWTDELQENVPEAMGRLAEQFAAQGHPLKAFAERYKVYRQRKQEIEADPKAPQGLPTFIGRTLAKGALRLISQVPGGGVVPVVVDEDQFASLAGDFASYVARKIGNKDEVRLVLEPVEVLTPLFLSGLRDIAEKQPVALFFDTYERTADFLDPWLRDLLKGRYGEAPANILLVIAGRSELDCNLWAPYEGLLARLPLEPFIEAEARDYLARKGITDERIVEVILSLSGQLPLLLATLAAEIPDDPSKVGDPSGEAVKRFLRWVEDPRRQQVALDAALPRRLNRDVLAVLAGEEEADALFEWLRGMPFVEQRGDCWSYHEVVRTQMLRHKRQVSPQGWADLHGRLATYYEGLRADLGLEEEAALRDETWQTYTLEMTYHRLCQAAHRHLSAALNRFVAAWDASADFARSLAGTVRQAGVDGDTAFVREWEEWLTRGLDAYRYGDHPQALAFLSAVLDEPGLEGQERAPVLVRRGEAYRRMGKYQEALADFDRAIELKPDDAWAIASRGETYRLMGRYEEALADFNRAIPSGHRAGRLGGTVGKVVDHSHSVLGGCYGANRPSFAQVARGCLLMLDGLDEVVSREERGQVRQEVEYLVNDIYPGNQVIVTAREAGYRDEPVFGDDFTRLDVQRLNDEQVRTLVANWCRQLYPEEEERRTEELMQAIREINELRTREDLPPLVSTPLMTTMVVSVKWGETELPRERAKLYEAGVKVILQAQYVPEDPARKEVVEWGGPWEAQRDWLSILALEMHEGGRDGAAIREERLREIPEPHLDPEALDRFVQAVRHRGGLLEERGEFFQFVHLTFQEFLAARLLAKQRERGWPRLLPHIGDPWWREVVLLTYGFAQADYPPAA